MRPQLGELVQKLKEIAKVRETNAWQPEQWTWEKEPVKWEILLLMIATELQGVEASEVRRVLPDGLEVRDAVLRGAGHRDMLLALKELGALLRRIVAGEADAQRVFLRDKRTKPGRWSEHRQIAIAYWRARACDPHQPDDPAIEAARHSLTLERPRPLSVATIRKIAQRYRADALEHLALFAGNGGASAAQVAGLVEYLRRKSESTKWDESIPVGAGHATALTVGSEGPSPSAGRRGRRGRTSLLARRAATRMPT